MPEIVLQATGLAKAFAAPAGPLPVLTAVSLEVRAGESVSIRGSSGSGKTTLLQLLGGLDVPDAGEVRVACEGALVAPAGAARYRVDDAGDGPAPWLELQFSVRGEPLIVGK